MSSPDALLTTIDEYLLSIAQGLHDAQRELERVSETGAPAAYSYYVPKLEFELRMTVETLERSTTPSGAERRMLLLRPVGRDASTSAQAVSVLRGSFIAVPNTSARAALRARSSVRFLSSRQAVVGVLVTDASGAPQPGLVVHFDVDRELSQDASRERGVDATLSLETTFSAAVVRTDERGRAESTLNIASTEPKGAVVVIALDAADQTEVIQHVLGEEG